ncbi:sigma 54-interacting transcriptional regulator [Oscillibacter hominis]|uniref:Sigma 54-interacting transcriptional regulator n=1 Tax=Oscillibacter hominis TaxID=2763056 RepID=A0A7G9B7G9_9FIRM|nr:sigma 54-interacting transcriptional regulator [Oscillibacter hominis]QNL45500.1 sigma 54-interacting transcriptional regulator [Oscillibacter hominis]
MLINYMQQAVGLYANADALIFCDKDGYVEYGKWSNNRYYQCSEVVGKHILELYPTLTEETSTIMRCLHSKSARIDDIQHLTNFKGDQVDIVSTTLPIVVDGKVIGALCASSYYGDGAKREKSAGKDGGLYQLSDIITENEQMKELKVQIAGISQTRSPVLIYGETGTGKELVAESIHTCGSRRDRPFIAQNCAAIPNTLLESLFFGTEKGSFTGAERKKGLFEMAEGGTLFLDEINSMDSSIQSKLLKALEEHTFRRVGGTRDIAVDTRVICAMNESPQEVLRSGKLRRDLFYRISVVPIALIPLRRRREDILPLSAHFIDHFNEELGRSIQGLSDLAVHAFLSHSWPGNVRELRNVIEHAFNVECSGQITIKSLPEYFFDSPAEEESCLCDGAPLAEAVGAYEKLLIQQALRSTGSITAAARLLKTSRQTLRYKMEKYQIG